ncbi:hypothetical protein T12_15283 [Trichinella patagoniensis]|uniref:Uncharacterized protein n=1 Tax=Trichinella patagoniensis TaxID=990121 RepID=A0A0V0Z2T2_9BILA|nr:hypothetical protein T12_15283 [Trichinella patagoniensis]
MGRARCMTTPIHHTTCYPTLTSLFLPPVDLQKGKRDTQPRIWSLGRAEDIRQSNDICRRAKNPEDIERRHSETEGMPEKTKANHELRSRRSTCVQESYARLCLSIESIVNCLTTELFSSSQPDNTKRAPYGSGMSADVNQIEERSLMTEELYRASGALQAEMEQDLEGEERQCATDDWARRRCHFRYWKSRARAIIEQARVDCGLTSRLAADELTTCSCIQARRASRFSRRNPSASNEACWLR